MYALVATHNAALRSAVLVLPRVCHPGCHVVLANGVADMHEALESGCCDTMVVDTQFTGYGRDFDAAMLRACYPRVNVLPLGGAGGSQAMLGALQRGLDAADYDAAPLRVAEYVALSMCSVSFQTSPIGPIAGRSQLRLSRAR
jgi:hypothetical protein